MSTIRVTLQENAYQFDKEGIIVPASDLSPSNIGELFYLLLNADAEFVKSKSIVKLWKSRSSSMAPS